MHRNLAVVVAVVSIAATAASGQLRVAPPGGRPDAAAFELLLRKLSSTGTFLQTVAHPDDEDNGLLAMLGQGRGMRTVLVSLTRGDGGQNEIGPELGQSLGVLRTEELLAVHRFDGAEQYFTRAIDFGYSFSVDESLQKWGRNEILGDLVRHIRTIRPDVIAGFLCGGEGGGQHHQASAELTREAFRAAADPTRYPAQIRNEGLHPWQALRYFCTDETSFAPKPTPRTADQLVADVSGFDAALGRTYAELGLEARSMHKCQGTSQLLLLPGQTQNRTYRLRYSVMDPGGASPADPYAGIDVTIGGLARFAGPKPPALLVSGLALIAETVAAARQAAGVNGPAAAIPALLHGRHATLHLAATITLSRDIFASDPIYHMGAAAEFEITKRLERKISEFDTALLIAAGVRLDALADDGVVTTGQAVDVSIHAAAATTPHGVTLHGVTLNGFDGQPFACAGDLAKAVTCKGTVRIPAGTPLSTPYWTPRTDAARYDFQSDVPFGVAFRPTPFRATFELSIGGGDRIRIERPVEYRYSDITAGEKRSELNVSPAFNVTVDPDIVIFPLGVPPEGGSYARSSRPSGSPGSGSRPSGSPGSASRESGSPGNSSRPSGSPGSGSRQSESPGSASRPGGSTPPQPVASAFRRKVVQVTVTNNQKGAANATVTPHLPAGWTSDPARHQVRFTREDEAATVQFALHAPATLTPGHDAMVKAVVATETGATSDLGYQVVEYPHVRRRHVVQPAAARLKVMDVTIAPGLQVGYVMGVGDRVPEAIGQLGADVALLDADTLAAGDLSRFHAIVLGVRAYERRPDLRANNQRLLKYAEDGGTLIVQYQKTEFDEAQYGPFPARISSDRITDESAPIEMLAPNHPVFTTPNRIGPDAWAGWLQERGTYFLGQRDPRYVDLLRSRDPFPYNPQEKTGILVEARVGKGRWIYTGLGLWRQLPAGTGGAYRLLANLISLGKP